MRRTAKIPKPWDTEEQKTIFYRYGLTHHWDELAPFFPIDYPAGSWVPSSLAKRTSISRYHETGDQTHHISGGILGTPRWNWTTNLIRLSDHTHRFCERFTRDGFALCAVAKIASGNWDSRKMAEIMRVDSVAGWLGEDPFVYDFVDQAVRPLLLEGKL